MRAFHIRVPMAGRRSADVRAWSALPQVALVALGVGSTGCGGEQRGA